MAPARGWPAVLNVDEITLRPLARSDYRAWRTARAQSAAWLHPWDASLPPGDSQVLPTFPELVRRVRRGAKDGTGMPFAVLVDGVFAGQVSVNNIIRGSAQMASIGYWVSQEFAGRNVIPRAVAAVIDHCFTAGRLHRIEICIRPENSNSLRVVEKLGVREVGYAPYFLHIDGAWRDHRIFAVTVEELEGQTMVERVRSALA